MIPKSEAGFCVECGRSCKKLPVRSDRRPVVKTHTCLGEPYCEWCGKAPFDMQTVKEALAHVIRDIPSEKLPNVVITGLL